MSGLRLASLIVGAVGIIVLATGIFILQGRLAIANNWLAVSARVVQASLVTVDSGVEDARSRIAYQLNYAVNGQPIATTAQSSEMPPDSYALQQNLRRHGPGTIGTIYVNPQRPSEVQLNVPPNIETLGLPLWLLLAALSLILMSISFWLVGAPGPVW